MSDLARGLAGRGHEVHVYAASGSEIPGVEVIDTGVDPRSLAAHALPGFRARWDPPSPARRPPSLLSPASMTSVQEIRYDVIHNHAFDAPAVRLATVLHVPVVHTLHLPPDEVVAAALRQAARCGLPPTLAAVSVFQANAWRRIVRRRRGPPAIHSHPVSSPGRGRPGRAPCSRAG